MGGGVAINFALTYPQLTRSLIAVDSALGGYPYTGKFNTYAPEIGIGQAKQRWLAHALFASANRNLVVTLPLRQMVTEWPGWEWLNHDSGRVPDPQPYYRLKEISAPTLVIVGEEDMPDFLGIADQLARDIPKARKVVPPRWSQVEHGGARGALYSGIRLSGRAS